MQKNDTLREFPKELSLMGHRPNYGVSRQVFLAVQR